MCDFVAGPDVASLDDAGDGALDGGAVEGELGLVLCCLRESEIGLRGGEVGFCCIEPTAVVDAECEATLCGVTFCFGLVESRGEHGRL